MTKLTYALLILCCVGLFAACSGGSGGGGGGMSITPPVNAAPEVAQNIPDQSLAVGRSATLDIAAMNAFRDPEGAVLSYEAASSETSVATVSMAGSTVTIRSSGALGRSDITIAASDPGDLTAMQTFTVTVEPNTAPIAAGTPPPLRMVTGTSQDIAVSSYFNDPEGEDLSYQAESSDTDVATVSVVASAVTIIAVASGSAQITVTASDPGGLTATQMFTVTISQQSSIAPTALGTIPSQSITVGTPSVIDLSGHFSGGNEPSYEAVSLNISVATVGVMGSVLTITPVAAGQTTITATIRNADGQSASQNFLATVSTPPNNAPLAVGSIASQSAVVGGANLVIDVRNRFRDPDGDTLSYTAVSLNPRIATVVSSSSRVTVTPVAAGTVTVRVTATDPANLSASHTFSVTVLADVPGDRSTTQTVAVGGSVTGSIDSVGDTDWFQVTLTSGTEYDFNLEGGTFSDPALALYNSAGVRLRLDDDSGTGLDAFIDNYTAPTSGTYYLEASGVGSNAMGTYTLSAAIELGDTPGDRTTTRTVAVEGSVTGNIDIRGDRDWFRVILAPNTVYIFDLEGSPTARGTLADPRLDLYSDTGRYLLLDRDSGTGTNARIGPYRDDSLKPVYFLEARSETYSGTGTYTLSVTRVGTDDTPGDSSTTRTVAVGGSVTGNIESFGDRDWFRVTLRANRIYRFDIEGSPTSQGTLADPSLQFYSETGRFLTFDWYSGTGLNARIEYTVPSDEGGLYFLDAQGRWGRSVGTYRLSVTRLR